MWTPLPAALLESALDVLVDHTFATSLTCLIFLCVALELVRYWRAEEEKQRRLAKEEQKDAQEKITVTPDSGSLLQILIF